MQLSRTPTWVKCFPDEGDKATLTLLARASKDSLDTPREMNFVLTDFKDANSIENALYRIEKEGWECTVMDQEGGGEHEPIKCVIECQKLGYQITEENFVRDSAFFQRIAKLYGVTLDGWYASGGTAHKPRLGWLRPTFFNAYRAAIIALVLFQIGAAVWRGYHADDVPAQPAATVGASPPPALLVPRAQYNPNAALNTYESPTVGFSLKYPNTWKTQESTPPCTAQPDGGSGLRQECTFSLAFANYHERYVPTYRVVRYANSLAEIEAYQKTNLKQDANHSLTKDSFTTPDGHPAIRYVTIADGTTTKLSYIQSGPKVFSFEGITPRGSTSDLDYFADYDRIFATFKVTY